LGAEHELEFVGGLDEAPADAGISVGVHPLEGDRGFPRGASGAAADRDTLVGYDHIAVAEAKARNVTVCNVPNYGENTVAEHSFALLLALVAAAAGVAGVVLGQASFPTRRSGVLT
jgi:hypothetical protein